MPSDDVSQFSTHGLAGERGERERGERDSTAGHAVEVLILTALQDELEGVLAFGASGASGEGGPAGWQREDDDEGYRCYRRAFPGAHGVIEVVAAWTGKVGDRAAAIRAQQLVKELDPACIAMCGICAGDRKKVSLGDVIVADQMYTYDEGKSIAKPGEAPEVLHGPQVFNLEPTWQMDAAFLARELDITHLAAARPPLQRRWLLEALYAHEHDGGPDPVAHPDRARCCPDWTKLILEAKRDNLVTLKGKSLRLTEVGKEKVEEDRILYPDGLPKMSIHVGAIATGHNVQVDAGLFDRLRGRVRTTIGVEMEGAGIAEVAARSRKKMILVKAVSNHADHEKDDAFREFACRASAEVLIAFLLKHLVPERGAREPERRVLQSVLGHDDPRDGFMSRVEQVVKLREPGANITRRPAAAPFSGLLEVVTREGVLSVIRVVGAVDQSISDALLTQYVSEIEKSYRDENPALISTLIHGGAQAPMVLAQKAIRRGVTLKSFGEYQGLIDFTRYLEWQTTRLEVDSVYPPWLYVDAPATWSLAGARKDEEKLTTDALSTLREMLEQPHRRFGLVLGDFGAGKTFLLHELARRMAVEKSPIVPVLVEMSRLEKQRSLKALLAQHFAMADEERIALDAFQYMLKEGKIALLFDGFDELALRLTYDRALEHFETVLAAAQGEAKVVVTSRTQHFLTDDQVRRELAKKAEQVGGYRLFKLEKFGERQIKRFLGNLIPEAKEAEERYALLHDVKDLLGLSENPRMLGFIAKIKPEKLIEAREGGEITAAKLYEILVGQWLDHEYKRANLPGAPKGVAREKLTELVTALASLFWERNARTLMLDDFKHLLVAEGIEPGVVEHMIGSGSLLVRDAEGRFSFVHRSVMEWLVAKATAEEIKNKGSAAALGADEMSELMADFFITLAGIEEAERWAYEKGGRTAGGKARTSAMRILKRVEALVRAQGGEIEIPMVLDLEGQDLRGQDWSRVNWQEATLRNANLEGATLRGADLRGADLRGARLGRADLEGAKLSAADATGADFRFAQMMRADLREVRGLTADRLRGAKLVGAQGAPVEGLIEVGAAPAVPKEALPMMAPGPVPAALRSTVAWNRAGDLLATVDSGDSIHLWDVVTGQPLRVLTSHRRHITSVAFSPDGKSLASGAKDNIVHLWDVVTGRLVRAYEGHSGWVASVAFSPDGKSLASGSRDNTVRLWDVSSARLVRVYKGHKHPVKSVAFSPDGKSLASGSYDNTVRLWDVSSARLVRVYEGHTDWVTSIALSPDGKTLASGSNDKTVRLWDVSSARLVRAYAGHTGLVTSIAFSPDGKTLVLETDDEIVHVWDVVTGRMLRAYKGHTHGVRSIAFSPDDNTFASENAHLLGMLRAYERRTNSIMSAAFSPDGHILASGSDDGTVRFWDVVTGRMVRAYERHTHKVMSVAFSPDGHTLASGSYDGTVRLWDVITGRMVRAYEGHTYGVMSVAFFSPDGKTLISLSEESTVRIWDMATARPVRAYEGHTHKVTSVAFSPDGHALASGSKDTTIRLWDVVTGRMVRAYEGHTFWVTSVAFSPDGKTLVSGSEDNAVRLWDVFSGRQVRAYEGHTHGVTSVAFSPNGHTLASGSYDNTIRLWYTASKRPPRILTGHLQAITAVTFSPDGLTLASASEDGTLRLWHVATGNCLAVLFPRPEGWVAFTPDGRYKLGGDIAGSFWHVIGLCRFEPGELDVYLPHLRVADTDPLFLPPSADAAPHR